MKSSPFAALLLVSVAIAHAQSISGLWDATVKFDNFTVPFPIEFSQSGNSIAASFFNGDQRVTSTSGTLTGNTLSVSFAQFGTKLTAILANGEIKGSYGGARNGFHDFEAKPHRNVTRANVKPPDIGGVWYMAHESGKGEHAWRLIVKQHGPDASASILRVDGDTGALVGGYEDGKFVLNHFDGTRASFLELVPKPDGTLGVTLKMSDHPVLHVTAVPLARAVKEGLPPFTDPKTHSQLKSTGGSLNASLERNITARVERRVLETARVSLQLPS
jgi:hypothetical protein